VRAIRRIHEGERALAYQPECGTSQVVSMASLWLVGAASLALAHALGGHADPIGNNIRVCASARVMTWFAAVTRYRWS
jgi:hypothetical protein